jgi:acyl-coenzyme A synthetase/AMP-(fatty) acid ligase
MKFSPNMTERHTPSAAPAQELKNPVKTQTAHYKYPRRIEFVPDLPKTPSGKIRRKELRMREFGK